MQARPSFFFKKSEEMNLGRSSSNHFLHKLLQRFNQTIMHFPRLSLCWTWSLTITIQIKNRDIAKCWCGSAENDTWDQTKPWADCGPAPILLLQSIFHSRPVTFTLFTSSFLCTQTLTITLIRLSAVKCDSVENARPKLARSCSSAAYSEHPQK